MTKPFTPHHPASKQRAFLSLDVEEALYGGAAGGGKSDALIMAALQYVDVPKYSAGIFRLKKTDLLKPDAILDRAHGWFVGTTAKWDDDLHGYRFPTRPNQPDATIHFGYAESKTQLEDSYQGASFQYIGVDELGQWTEDAYRYLFSRLRGPKGMGVPLRMRAGTNPGGRGAEWIKRRFISFARTKDGFDHKQFRALRRSGQEPSPPYLVSPPTPEGIEAAKLLNRPARGAYFVPAFVDDNPGLDADTYRAEALVQLDPTTRAQLEEGDFDAVESGEYFREEWFSADRYLDAMPPELKTVRYWDLAGTKARPGRDPDFTAGARVGVLRQKDGRYKVFIVDMAHFREDPGGTEARVAATAAADGKSVPVWLEEEPGSAGKNNTNNYASRVLFGHQVHGHRKTGPKPEFWKALSSVARNGMLYLVRGNWNGPFIRELCSIPVGHDDQADAASGGFAVQVTAEVSMLAALRSASR